MDPVLAPFAARARGRVAEDEFERRVRAVAAEFEGLLDDEAAALFVLDELGLNDGAFVTLNDLAGRAEATVRVTLDRVEPPREFAREGRPPGRVCNCVISDATGQARLVLWDRDVEKTEDGTLKPGARVTVVNARVKESRWGVELHVGPWTALEVEGALTPAQRKLLQDVQDPGAETPAAGAPAAEAAARAFTGVLLGVSPTRTYRRSDGRAGFACDVDIDAEGAGRVRIVAWDEAVRSARALKPLAAVRVEGVTMRARGAAEEWSVSAPDAFRAA